MDFRSAVRASGVPDCVGYGTQAHRGICWAFAVRQLPPQGIGQIRTRCSPVRVEGIARPAGLSRRQGVSNFVTRQRLLRGKHWGVSALIWFWVAAVLWSGVTFPARSGVIGLMFSPVRPRRPPRFRPAPPRSTFTPSAPRRVLEKLRCIKLLGHGQCSHGGLRLGSSSQSAFLPTLDLWRRANASTFSCQCRMTQPRQLLRQRHRVAPIPHWHLINGLGETLITALLVFRREIITWSATGLKPAPGAESRPLHQAS